MGTLRSGWLADNPNNDNYSSCGNFKNRFIGAFATNTINLDKLYNLLNSANFFDDISLLFNNPQEWITNIIVYPFQIPYTGEWKYCYIGKTNTESISDETLKVQGVTPNFLTDNPLINLGVAKIESKFDNFMDYEGYTTIDVFLPFLGFVSVSPSDVMNKYLYVDLYIDYFTGQALYYLSIGDTDNVDSTQRRLISKHSLQLGYSIPLGSTNALENSRNIFLGSLGSALKSGGNLTSLVDITSNAIGNLQTSPTTEKANNSILDVATSKMVKIVIKRPTPLSIDYTYYNLFGKPLEEERTLRDLQGFTKVSEVNISPHPIMTDEEITELETLLKEGVIF